MSRFSKRRKKTTCPPPNESEGEMCPKDKKPKQKDRNCYTIEVCDEKLLKSQHRLQSLIDCKRQLEMELDKSLDEIKCLAERIDNLECKIEKLVASQAAKECQERMKEEICLIKEERKKTESDLKHYRKQLCEKLERLKRCSGKPEIDCD